MLIKNGRVVPELLRLAQLQGLEIPEEMEPQYVSNILQGAWKAPAGVVRADIQGPLPDAREIEALGPLGASAIPINLSKKYHGTLLLGATLKAVTRRMKFMLDEELDPQKRFRQGSVPQPVYLLGSRRRLDPKQEMTEHVPAILHETGARFNDQYEKDARLGNWPETEIEMMDRVSCWMNTQYWIHHLISAPDVQKSDGSGNRSANTAETVKDWLRVAFHGHFLVVSSQPFCENQKMAVERAVKEVGKKEGYTFDVCGPEAPPLPLSRWLDNLAKQLWEEVQLLPK